MSAEVLPRQPEPRRVLLDYPHRKAGHCGSGALRDLLEWAGLGWEEVPGEGLVFGMGGGLGFTYLRVPGLAPPIYIVGRSSDLEVDLLARLGAEVDVRGTDDPMTGWDWVRRELQQGRPVLLWADIAELPYLNVRLQMSRHDIVAIGYDDDTETAFVVDNDRADVQEVPYQALARARASRSFPVPTRHTTYFVNWPQILPDLRSTAAAALVASVENMQAAATAIIPDTSALPPDAVAAAGTSGVAVFAEDVDRWRGFMPEPELDVALRSLHAFVEKAGTGGGLFRRLQAQFCADVARLTGSAEMAKAGTALLRCADTWSALAAAGRSDGSTLDRWRRVNELAATLPTHEDHAVSQMRMAAAELAMGGDR
ncbi:BtrH N-terminal domain-containing protein [Janibacter sp. YIM B02568]|uniref:BtrH N-terminal domain-containing protein n=1 Tax=Janibacter endophyticus TaxID=2806261 RepID=UPI000C55F0D6|nr:BtrH N-terminal domain-containing protein [Janibacter endophyticus]MBM6547261.1 BtrH N-terminal domain-containing protein [Janibacter endophyticus]MBS45575.1 PRTRC system protein E [Nocardioides sp.]